ncbi:MAG TPA: glycosyltransferase [Gammaproteobacteria bacterium]|nr:glycosyltransferase [Gammaproteobacteria bacterium]
MSAQLVSILLPNHRTPELTCLCLRLLHKHTPAQLARVIVVDNASDEVSLTYLRSLDWITLLERNIDADSDPAQSHARALDLALSQVTTPYVCSIHTDTLIKRGDWLDYLLNQIRGKSNCAGVGSWKLDTRAQRWQWILSVEQVLQRHFPRLKGRRTLLREQRHETGRYLRSHCALYRTDLIRRYQLSFVDNGISSTGRCLHQSLVTQGHRMVFLPEQDMSFYLEHLNHATILLNPRLHRQVQYGVAHPLQMYRRQRRMRKKLLAFGAEEVLNDDSLDR